MRFTIVILFIFFFSVSFAQKKKAEELYYKAKLDLQYNKLTQAAGSLKTATELNKEYVEAYLLLAETYVQLDLIENVLPVYQNLVKYCKDEYPFGHILLGELESYMGNYIQALEQYKSYINSESPDPRYKMVAEKNIKTCEFAINAIANPVPFKPINLGFSVNSEHDEYLPALTADEQTLIITRKLPKAGSHYSADYQEDFYICYKDSSSWTYAMPISASLNSKLSEGAQSISADGRFMFFTACNRRDGKGSCDIYFTKKERGNWLKPMNIGNPVNTSGYEGQPSISPDGKTLYFVSDRISGHGAWDIWRSTIMDDGTFSQPENLGKKINSSDIEQSPFIHTDNQTLYFSSYGHIGMGSTDIYVTRKDDTGNWTDPENLGYPINTSKNESSLIVNARGNIAYFASERDSNYGGTDIYMFELYKEARPVATTYFKGKVYDADTEEPIKASFELIDLESGEIAMTSSSSSDGDFLVCLPSGKNYAMNVSKKAYMFFSENFSLKEMNDETSPFLMDVPLQPIKAGQKIVLKNIFFDTNKYNLKQESVAELTKLIQFLNENPTLKVEIGGHTDDVGNDQSNQVLSENRAKSVYNYLIEESINKERLSYKGYGENQPIDVNSTVPGRANNRRTEIKIVE